MRECTLRYVGFCRFSFNSTYFLSSAKQEREERDKEIKARQKNLEIAEYNKLKAICTREIECSQTNKLSSDRQSLIVRNESRLKKKERDVEEYNGIN